jgi:crotonobetainyl-CoA:carnitine CoA-transferase CaiB-like acyl-CoA transferase
MKRLQSRVMAGPLAGIRVVELATGVAGPYCGRLLAGLGAEVIKLEPPGGDPARLAGPFPGDVHHLERSGLFLHLNGGKRSVVPEAAGLPAGWQSLFERADVLITDRRSSAGGTPSEPSIEALNGKFPGIVVVSVTLFGLTGPYADYAGSELVTYALSGYMSLTGAPDREPIKSYGDLVQYQAGAHAALGAMAALLARERTGKGQVVDVSAMEAGTFLLGGVEQNAHFYGTVARRNGTRLMGFPPQHSYPSTIRPCADGFVHAHANNRYGDLLGVMIPHPRLADPELLHALFGHADEIDAIMDEWLADKTRDEVVKTAQELRLPFTEVRTPGEVLRETHHRERKSFVKVQHPGMDGPLLQPGAPIRFSATPWEAKPAPTLGELTEAEWAVQWPAGEAAGPWPATLAGIGSPRPLSGVRVIDFTNAVAGPIASSILGALGAEVIKVEAPRSRPRRAAGTAPLKEGGTDLGWDRMMMFNCFNHGKLSVSLDVSKPEGRDLFLKLAAESHVVVQNFAPRVMGNLGLDYEALRAVRPDIVLVSMPAFGLSGPYRDRVSYGPGIDAMSGLSHLTGYPDGPPMKPGNFFCDQNAAVHAAFATISALWHLAQTGVGQHVELAMIEGEFQLLADAYLDFVMNGRERMRTGNDHPTYAPHGVFACKGDDAWVAIAVETDSQWRELCSEFGEPYLAEDVRFSTAHKRHEHRRWIAPIVAGWVDNLVPMDVQERLQARGVPAGAVLNVGELLKDPHVAARGGFQFVETPNVGPTPYPRVAFTLSGTPVPLEKPAPAFAGANDYVFRELLGLSDAEIAALETAQVVTREPLGGASH